MKSLPKIPGEDNNHVSVKKCIIQYIYSFNLMNNILSSSRGYNVPATRRILLEYLFVRHPQNKRISYSHIFNYLNRNTPELDIYSRNTRAVNDKKELYLARINRIDKLIKRINEDKAILNLQNLFTLAIYKSHECKKNIYTESYFKWGYQYQINATPSHFKFLLKDISKLHSTIFPVIDSTEDVQNAQTQTTEKNVLGLILLYHLTNTLSRIRGTTDYLCFRLLLNIYKELYPHLCQIYPGLNDLAIIRDTNKTVDYYNLILPAFCLTEPKKYPDYLRSLTDNSEVKSIITHQTPFIEDIISIRNESYNETIKLRETVEFCEKRLKISLNMYPFLRRFMILPDKANKAISSLHAQVIRDFRTTLNPLTPIIFVPQYLEALDIYNYLPLKAYGIEI